MRAWPNPPWCCSSPLVGVLGSGPNTNHGGSHFHGVGAVYERRPCHLVGPNQMPGGIASRARFEPSSFSVHLENLECDSYAWISETEWWTSMLTRPGTVRLCGEEREEAPSRPLLILRPPFARAIFRIETGVFHMANFAYSP